MHSKEGLKEYKPEFGQGKDMKAKTRAKWYPRTFVFPGEYTAPADLHEDDWRPADSDIRAGTGDGTENAVGASAAGGGPGGPVATVDKPFAM